MKPQSRGPHRYGLSSKTCAVISAIAAAFLLFDFPAYANSSCFPREMMPAECAIACMTNSAGATAAMNRANALGEGHASQNTQTAGMNGMAMPSNAAAEMLTNEVSGTSMNPLSSAMPMRMVMAGNWNLAFMANGFITNTQQSGP